MLCKCINFNLKGTQNNADGADHYTEENGNFCDQRLAPRMGSFCGMNRAVLS
ncbi:hypothetical protein SCH4B_0217 [Ruegeria sp. TrichCH4B]|nr:hypothetical protein SCH4B_0217 [Ruegeria sp. TrichCH4B]